jgi:hypothetical protein
MTFNYMQLYTMSSNFIGLARFAGTAKSISQNPTEDTVQTPERLCPNPAQGLPKLLFALYCIPIRRRCRPRTF